MSKPTKRVRKPARSNSVTVRNFFRNFDIQVCRVRPSGHTFLDVRAGDLVVRKFYKPKVLRVTGVLPLTGGGQQRVMMVDDEGNELWERPSELLNPKLYSIHAVPDVEQVAAKVVRVAAARAGAVS